MRTIYKYEIEILDIQAISPPFGARFIHAGLDPQQQPCLWAEVETENCPEPIAVFVVGTGNPIPQKAVHHVGSFNQGPFVWHIYTA